MREKKKSYGNENPDKTFYVIRSASSVVGLYSYVLTFSGRIKEALERGYIPVIDMQSKSNPYLEENQIGKVNAWELYYEQPEGISLDDIKKSKNIIFSSGDIPNNYPSKSTEFLYDDKLINDWHQLFEKYIRLNVKTKSYVDDYYKNMFPEGARVLGVLARGTDYMSLKPYKHPIQPEPSDIIEKSIEIMKKYNCQYIYLTTEDLKIFNLFKNTFGKSLLFMNVERYVDTKNNKFITMMENDRDNDKYLKGLEYLTTIELLAKCNCLVAGRAGGSVAARLISNSYEFCYFFDLGNYGVDNI